MKYLILIVVVMLSIATGCARNETITAKKTSKIEKAVEETPAADVQQKILAFNLEGVDEKGGKQWEIKGESAEAVSENEIKLANIVAKSYGNEAEATLVADEGVYDKSKNNVIVEKNVKVTVENAQSLAKDYAALPGELTATPDPSPITHNPSPKTKTVITCDGEAGFDYEKNLAYFDKNVKVVSEDGTIEADKITVNLETETKKINDIVAEGNVKIARGENITYSEKATYFALEKKVVLTGNPRLVIYHEGDAEQSFLKQ